MDHGLSRHTTTHSHWASRPAKPLRPSGGLACACAYGLRDRICNIGLRTAAGHVQMCTAAGHVQRDVSLPSRRGSTCSSQKTNHNAVDTGLSICGGGHSTPDGAARVGFRFFLGRSVFPILRWTLAPTPTAMGGPGRIAHQYPLAAACTEPTTFPCNNEVPQLWGRCLVVGRALTQPRSSRVRQHLPLLPCVGPCRGACWAACHMEPPPVPTPSPG